MQLSQQPVSFLFFFQLADSDLKGVGFLEKYVKLLSNDTLTGRLPVMIIFKSVCASTYIGHLYVLYTNIPDLVLPELSRLVRHLSRG